VEKSHIKIDTVLSYCRCTPFDQTLHKYLPYFEACFEKYSLFALKINTNKTLIILINYDHEKGLGIINASVLGIGLLTNGLLPYWHCAGNEIRTACSQAVKYCNVSH
jgi:hypothetical protein